MKNFKTCYIQLFLLPLFFLLVSTITVSADLNEASEESSLLQKYLSDDSVNQKKNIATSKQKNKKKETVSKNIKAKAETKTIVKKEAAPSPKQTVKDKKTVSKNDKVKAETKTILKKEATPSPKQSVKGKKTVAKNDKAKAVTKTILKKEATPSPKQSVKGKKTVAKNDKAKAVTKTIVKKEAAPSSKQSVKGKKTVAKNDKDKAETKSIVKKQTESSPKQTVKAKKADSKNDKAKAEPKTIVKKEAAPSPKQNIKDKKVVSKNNKAMAAPKTIVKKDTTPSSKHTVKDKKTVSKKDKIDTAENIDNKKETVSTLNQKIEAKKVVSKKPETERSIKVKLKKLFFKSNTPKFQKGKPLPKLSKQFGTMKLKTFVKQVVKHNETLKSKRLEYDVSMETVNREESIFEPKLINTFQQSAENKLKTDAEIVASLDLNNPTAPSAKIDNEFEDFNSSIEGTLKTGASVKLGYTHHTSKDLVNDTNFVHTSFMGVELTQPLLKGAGDTATASVRSAKIDSQVAFQTYRKELMGTALNALFSCWDFYNAKGALFIRSKSVSNAEQILIDNKERVALGKMSKTEILEAEAALAKRRALLIEAKQSLVKAENILSTYLSFYEEKKKVDLNFKEYLEVETTKPVFENSIKTAFENKPEYLAAKSTIEKQNILISYAKNQRWPQLDLFGSYGLNGLGDSTGSSFDSMYDGNYKSWKAGITFSIPLYGGVNSRSSLAISKHRKRQALSELKAAETEILNNIDATIKEVHSSRDQLQNYTNARSHYRKILNAELEMFNMGRSNSRLVLEKEEDLNEALESELESFVYCKKVALALKAEEGVILKDYSIEIMEDKNSEKTL